MLTINCATEIWGFDTYKHSQMQKVNLFEAQNFQKCYATFKNPSLKFEQTFHS